MTTTFSDETLSGAGRRSFAASFAQQHSWFLDQLEPGSALTTFSATVQVNQSLSVEVLERSLDLLVQRHGTLRTTFAMREGQLIQLITAHSLVTLAARDLRGLSEAEQQAQIRSLSSTQAQLPFALEQGPLLRCTLVLLGEERSQLLLNLHSAICDAWSVGVLVHDLASLYEACSQGKPSPLPPLPVQYAQLAKEQQEGMARGIFAEDIVYWKQQLAQAPETQELPTDRPQPAVASWRGASYEVVLPGELNQSLQEVSRQQQVSQNIVLATAYAALLSRYSDQEDLLIGNEVPARSRAGTESLIGPFENLQPLHVDLSGNPSFAQLFERMRQTMQEAQTHEDLPFELLLKEVPNSRTLGRNLLVRAMLRLPLTQPPLPDGWRLTHLEEGTGTAQFDLTLELQDSVQGLLARFIYRTDLFEKSTIARLAGHWQTLLESIVADIRQPLAHVSLLTVQERFQLLEEWTATEKPYPQHALAQLFEAQVARRPEAIAVICEEEQISYQEL
ncbi:MAG: non-ribosomal peptide synthetase, partial [Chloroflexi bacterium]|nr:non-ribosomal peptide synthetase [Chloroflexota bacterium]